MNLDFDVNEAFERALQALEGGLPFWMVFILFVLIMSPWLVPAISNAIAQHRALSHKREQNLLKIRNSVQDRQKRLKPPSSPRR